MGLIVFILVGAIAGFLAGKVMTGHGLGVIWDIVVGILGAFLGGLTLAETPYRVIVQSEIAPFRGLLLGFFFLPLTTLVYAWLTNTHSPMEGVNLVYLLVAVIVDLGGLGGGESHRRRRL